MSKSPIVSNVGILAIEFYCPPYYVEQSELEKYDKVSSGKYTVGLGQKRMAFCSDAEDVNSLSLTVFHRLLERHTIDPKSIGLVEVATETVVDKSKSISTVVTQILESAQNFDVGGVDNINACFGGTQALINAVNHVYSPFWDRRYAVVIMADIASYAEGPARCTGGAGAVAMLIGPNAPLVVDTVFAFHKKHVYDFYKPIPESEYPVVDGKLSIECYTDALDSCFLLYRDKFYKKYGKYPSLDSFAGVCFHAPYCKLVQKSLARLKCLELLSSNNLCATKVTTGRPDLDAFFAKCESDAKKIQIDEHDYKSMEKAILEYSKPLFADKTQPSLFLAEQIGNMYTPSLYVGLISLLTKKPLADIAGKRILMFSYGSGSIATMFNLCLSPDHNDESALSKIVNGLSIEVLNHITNQRIEEKPEMYAHWMMVREKAYGKAPYKPIGQITDLQPDTYYLLLMDEKYRRFYEKTPKKTKFSSINGHC